uniref:Uncharacterized protein n=1 Tax=Oreochromis niloticus TaxID=8128 RepID=A0A669ELE4_ORENI
MEPYCILLSVKGLNSPLKCTSILDFLHRQKLVLALLQETNLRPVDVNRMENKYCKTTVASGDGSKQKGVMILMKRNYNIQEKINSSFSVELDILLL